MFSVDLSVGLIPVATMIVALATFRARVVVVLAYVLSALSVSSWSLWWIMTFMYLVFYLYQVLSDAL